MLITRAVKSSCFKRRPGLRFVRCLRTPGLIRVFGPYDIAKVLEGETEAETSAKIERFVYGDRTLPVEAAYEVGRTVAGASC